jgi:hypothetical protein
MGGHHYDENDDVSTDAHEQNPMNSIMFSFYQLSVRSGSEP